MYVFSLSTKVVFLLKPTPSVSARLLFSTFIIDYFSWVLGGTQHYMTCRHDSQESYTFSRPSSTTSYLLALTLRAFMLSDVSVGSFLVVVSERLLSPSSYYPIKFYHYIHYTYATDTPGINLKLERKLPE